jgi:hypothetical protein
VLARADTAPRADLRLGRRRVQVRLEAFDLPDTAFPTLPSCAKWTSNPC